jgi:two-component system sensor histidine kinase CpxA
MRSLFLRVFLWFWLAMAMVVTVMIVTSPFFTRSRPGLDRWHRDAESWAGSRAERVAAHISRHGTDGIPPRRGHGQGRGAGPPSPARVFILDIQGREIRDAEAPSEVVELARQTLDSGAESTRRTGFLHLVARPASDPQGNRYAVVAAHHSPPRLVHLLDPQALVWRLAALVLVVGALSFWLARYLSSPVGALRSATRSLSDGDLSARVGGKVGRRKDEIGELARDFDAMAERLEALVGSQQRLLRDVSHELRSPLARLGVALELARSRSGEDVDRALDRIEREADRLDELIGRLLLLERLEGEGRVHDPRRFDLSGLVVEVVADARFEAEAKGCEVGFETAEAIELVGHEHLIRSAVDNVLRNAVNHTANGTSVEVVVAAAEVGVSITVRDHGPGVAEDELGRIFEPFYRVDEARDRESGGAGLGLAIAARAVEAHGGTIDAANHPDGGLLVTIRLAA